MTKAAKNTERLLAVLIDAENTPAKYADAIFKELAALGQASVRRVYGNFLEPNLKSWNDILAKHALIPHQQPAYTKGKNSSDIALVIDAMDLLHSARFDGFVLVSSDSDFTRLASRIREQGQDVIGVGNKNTTESLCKACKQFIFLENLVSEKEGQENSMGPKATEKPQFPEPQSTFPVVQLIRKFMEKQDEKWVPLSPIGIHIRTAMPEFDPRTYGCSNLSSLVEKTRAFEVNRDNGVKIREKPR